MFCALTPHLSSCYLVLTHVQLDGYLDPCSRDAIFLDAGPMPCCSRVCQRAFVLCIMLLHADLRSANTIYAVLSLCCVHIFTRQ